MLLNKSSLGFLSLAVLSIRASPLTATQSFTVNYNFDTIVTNPAAVGAEVREYDLLYFQNINTINRTLAVSGLDPHTFPNEAVFATNTQLLDMDGTDFRITSEYPRSSISSFDAVSWYYGCSVASGEVLASIPANCTITATGYNKAGKKAAQQDFVFVATLPKQVGTYAKFSWKFAGLKYIVLTVSNPAVTNGGFDNFIATLRQNASAPLY